jgi:hypothetical protein
MPRNGASGAHSPWWSSAVLRSLEAAEESLWHSFLVSISVFLVVQIIGTSLAYYTVLPSPYRELA